MAMSFFILGAGASRKPAGHSGRLLEVAESLLKTNKVEAKRKPSIAYIQAIGALQAVHSKAQLDLTNIETIFNAFETARISKKYPLLDGHDV